MNDTSCEVTVVPILEPKITPTACVSVIKLELTNATTSAVQADDDWITAVKNRPTSIPVNRFVVKNSRIDLILAPAAFSMPSLMTCMPNKNSASPPANGISIPATMVPPIPSQNDI